MSNTSEENPISDFVSKLFMKILYEDVYKSPRYEDLEPPEGGILKHISHTTDELQELISSYSPPTSSSFKGEILDFLHESLPSFGSMWHEDYTEITDMTMSFIEERYYSSQE